MCRSGKETGGVSEVSGVSGASKGSQPVLSTEGRRIRWGAKEKQNIKLLKTKELVNLH